MYFTFLQILCFLKMKQKSVKKFTKKNIFPIWSLYVVRYKINGYVEFYSDFWLYTVLYFILYIQFNHFCIFSCYHKIQKLIFVFYFFNTFYVFENKTKVCLEFIKKLFFQYEVFMWWYIKWMTLLNYSQILDCI